MTAPNPPLDPAGSDTPQNAPEASAHGTAVLDAPAAVPPAATAPSDAADAAGAGAALARLYGEPLLQLPQDLYIPPEALEVFLDTFEGPLDLLLYLIRKQNFNVLDIPMAQVTHQYLSYVEQVRSRNLELAGEYLLMAAMLIEIKSRMLLPAPKAAPGEEAEDPRAELVRRLLEYEQMKQAARRLDAMPQAGRDFQPARVHVDDEVEPVWPSVAPEELHAAFAALLRRAKLVQHHKISRETLSVREHMTQILRALRERRFVEFSDLFGTEASVPVVVVNFVALLELTRESLVELTQAEPFAPIYVRLAYTPVRAQD